MVKLTVKMAQMKILVKLKNFRIFFNKLLIEFKNIKLNFKIYSLVKTSISDVKNLYEPAKNDLISFDSYVYSG